MKLHDVAAEIEHLLGTQVDQDTGEITPETLAALDSLELDRSQRALDLCCYALGLQREASAVEARALELTQRADKLQRKAASLLDYVRSYIDVGEKLSDDRVSIAWRTSTRVEIEDAEKIPDCYQRVIPRRFEPDKKAIGDAIKSGEEVPGASLATVATMRVK